VACLPYHNHTMGGPGSGRKRVLRDPSLPAPKKSPARKKSDVGGQSGEECVISCSRCGKLFKSKLGVKYHLGKFCDMNGLVFV
jgi:hypothetical protein